MDVGQQTIEWLFSKQLNVDEKWSERTPGGFRWWADRNAQTIEVIGEVEGPDGDSGHLVSVRTDFLRSVDLSERSLTGINALQMRLASLAGPVYDPETRSLSLCSLVEVHQGNAHWMRPIIGMTAVLQLGEARNGAAQLAEAIGAEEALSGHPANGSRPEADELAHLSATLPAAGADPGPWQEPGEFQQAVEEHMQRPPALLATAGGAGLAVEFPFADESSLCQVMGTQPHPRYGNGLLVLQSFPAGVHSEAEGAQLALSLNADDLLQRPAGYGLGSYAYRNGMIHFSSFFPNAMYQAGLLVNLYYSCAARARAAAVRLTGEDWTQASFDPSHSSIGRAVGSH